jgi:beta-glucosidase/6-phospho-beta-glucosidase/beta-galactosidase
MRVVSMRSGLNAEQESGLQSTCAFRSFFQGGFECSTHYQQEGRRLDLIASTRHDQWAASDYAMLAAQAIRTCRDGVRWHLIEPRAGQYNVSSFVPMLRAARRTGMQVIWDLCHYGWPDGLDIFHSEFVDRFARFSGTIARVVSQETDETPYFCPMNEMSFFAWAAAEVGCMGPFRQGRGPELKKQLVRATVAGIEAIRREAPSARIVHVDPLIHIVTPADASTAVKTAAHNHLNAQFEAWDMLAGLVCPELGGRRDYLDIVGCNYYVHNQWVYGGRFFERSDPRYRPLWRMLAHIWHRYRRPLFLAETGIESERRPEWLRYVSDEAATAILNGVPLEGICLYPIVNHPGWADDRHCQNGMWDYSDDTGQRDIYVPLADELALQQARFADLLDYSTPVGCSAEVTV